MDGKYSLKCLSGKQIRPKRRNSTRDGPELMQRDRKVELVALASQIRTGNSWVRYLVEAATGIVTEAVYMREGALRTPEETWYNENGFKAQANRTVVDGESVLVKTHEYTDTDFVKLSDYSRAIRIIRFPLDIEPWYRFVKTQWHSDPMQAFVERCAQFLKWHLAWNCFAGEQLFIRYEDLKANTSCVLKRILDFLNYKYTEKSINRAVSLYPPTSKLQDQEGKRKVGWDVPDEFLEFAIPKFRLVVREFGYEDLFEEVLKWRTKRMAELANPLP